MRSGATKASGRSAGRGRPATPPPQLTQPLGPTSTKVPSTHPTPYEKTRPPLSSGAAWDEALERGLDALEDEIMRRAKDGVGEPIYYRGAVVGETRRYSDTLAMFILKSKRREIWGERTQIDMKYDWSNLTEAERVRKAMQMLDIAEELVHRPLVIEATPIRYDPTDGDELADAERRRKRLEDLGQDDPEGGIGR